MSKLGDFINKKFIAFVMRGSKIFKKEDLISN